MEIIFVLYLFKQNDKKVVLYLIFIIILIHRHKAWTNDHKKMVSSHNQRADYFATNYTVS